MRWGRQNFVSSVTFGQATAKTWNDPRYCIAIIIQAYDFAPIQRYLFLTAGADMLEGNRFPIDIVVHTEVSFARALISGISISRKMT
ncbi:hypothetical protein K450DRAFT_260025 [Umbelopsis ramanniana AG]|uniref:Uncharacterized protein n=1 Tax=Umbelopsis ramanniana AG TaxID=1314678 RepID=A0AAD5E258_UMBRA|nr:uncharacterized protein K450DRAFT_260025 [Umbelopsis ramanniana AG]KAI8575813.1 hypothetical protein K450DRAFT_260025 [Umbelopsis ramanniana AG]